MRWLWVCVGGALGTGCRFWVNGLISTHQGRGGALPAVFPLGTMVVNVSGCFVVGLLAAVAGPSAERLWLRPEWRDFLIVGFCGGYTTFSSYGLQTLELARSGSWLAVGVNVVASNALGLLAVYLGRVMGLLLQLRLAGRGA